VHDREIGCPKGVSHLKRDEAGLIETHVSTIADAGIVGGDNHDASSPSVRGDRSSGNATAMNRKL
jgi:hypothetical protein